MKYQLLNLFFGWLWIPKQYLTIPMYLACFTEILFIIYVIIKLIEIYYDFKGGNK